MAGGGPWTWNNRIPGGGFVSGRLGHYRGIYRTIIVNSSPSIENQLLFTFHLEMCLAHKVHQTREGVAQLHNDHRDSPTSSLVIMWYAGLVQSVYQYIVLTRINGV